MPPARALPVDLAAFLESGLSIAIGTRDEGLAPEGARVWAARVDADGAHLEAFVYAPAIGPTLKNLEANAQMALVFDRPTDHRACQVKGTFIGWRPTRADERAEIMRQFDAFCASLDAIRLPGSMMRGSAQLWPSVALRMRVTDAFSQDPGPGAGERLT